MSKAFCMTESEVIAHNLRVAKGRGIACPESILTDVAAAPGTEGELQDEVVAYLRSLGLFLGIANPTLKSTYTVGWPDISFPFRGKFVAIELKTKTGKLRPEQQAAHLALKINGAHVFVCRSVEDVRSALEEVEKSTL